MTGLDRFAFGALLAAIVGVLVAVVWVEADIRDELRAETAAGVHRSAAQPQETEKRGANGCGAERAAVKHLTDGYTLGLPHVDTIDRLVTLQPPPVGQDSPRFTHWTGPHRLPEGRLIQLTAVAVVAAKQEADSDLHVIVQGDYSRQQMNVELPAARCDQNSRYAFRLATARAHADQLLGPVSSSHYTPEDVRATIRGPIFYDVLHGQRGAANGVELHPVTMFNPVK